MTNCPQSSETTWAYNFRYFPCFGHGNTEHRDDRMAVTGCHNARSPRPSQHTKAWSPHPSRVPAGSSAQPQSPDPGITTTQPEMGPGEPRNLHNMAPRRGLMAGHPGLPLGQKNSRPEDWESSCWESGKNPPKGECGSCSPRPGFGCRLCHPTSCVTLGTFPSLSEPVFSHTHTPSTRAGTAAGLFTPSSSTTTDWHTLALIGC